MNAADCELAWSPIGKSVAPSHSCIPSQVMHNALGMAAKESVLKLVWILESLALA